MIIFQSKNKVLKSIEKLIGEKIHDNLLEIISEAGFSNKIAIKSISQSNLSSIEQYINKNRERFTEILNGTRYEGFEQFEFLPGHAALLLSLPSYIEKLESTKKIQTRKRRHSCITEVQQNRDHPGDHPQSEDRSADYEEESEAERLHIEGVRQLLIKKINNFASKKGLKTVITDDNIKNFRVEANSNFNCDLKCPILECNRKVPCNYCTHWVCGNFQTHLKSHFTFEQYEVISNNNSSDNSTLNSNCDGPISQKQLPIVRIGNGQQIVNVLNRV